MKNIILVVGVLCAVLVGAQNAAAPWAVDLALARGNFWRQRAPIAVSNPLDKSCAGSLATVSLDALGLVGTRVEELRLVDERGKELLYSVWAKDRVTAGKIPAGAEFTLPVTLPARGKATYWLYWDNPVAWGLADSYPEKAARTPSQAMAQAGAPERLNVRFDGETAVWPAGVRTWDFRVPVRLLNLTKDDRAKTLTSFPLNEALRGVQAAEMRLFDGSTELTACPVGDRMFFSCAVPAQTAKTIWFYVKAGARRTAAKKEAATSTLGSVIPSDQVLVQKADVPDLAAFEQLCAGTVNLVTNGGFEEDMEGWQPPVESAANGVSYAVMETGGFSGKRFAKMSVPAKAPSAWRGWHQNISIIPGRCYFFGGALAAENLDEPTSIYVHTINRAGRTTQTLETNGRVEGTTPWAPRFGYVTTRSDDVKLILHLTTRGHGTLSHDGIFVTEFLPSQVGDPEAPPATGSMKDLVVQAVDPVIKVFHETPVKDERTFHVSLARNETEPLQLAIRSPEKIPSLDVVVTPPAALGLTVETGWVDYVPVDYKSSYYSLRTPVWELKRPPRAPNCDGWTGWWPDPIRPETTGTLVANKTQPIWLNVKTTAQTPPGDYQGKIEWKAAGRVLRTDTFRVRVWNFTLPAIAETPAVFDVRMQSPLWQETFKGMDEEARRRAIWKFYSEKRICPETIGNNIRFKKTPEGRVTADFTAYDVAAKMYFEDYHFPVSYTPWCFYFFGWALPPSDFLGEKPYPGTWPFKGADRTQLRPEYKRVVQAAIKLYWDHMKAKGWANRIVFYVSDEPHFHRKDVRDQMKALCAMIHEVDPAIKIYSSTWRHCPEWNGSLDVWGVGHYGCFPVSEMKARAAAGQHLWFTTDGQFCLDTPYCAVERLLPHYCVAFQAEAYEFWGATWLTYNPWKFGWHAFIHQTDTPGDSYYVRYPNGDGYLIYPGIPGRIQGPSSCVRLEAARDGVEDFSYLKALERLAAKSGPNAEAAKALLAKFRALVSIPNAGGRHSTQILPEPEKINLYREEAGELLSR
ncbi:MAG: DUF4091 domain-containing protein [Kiritimatiellae bacterium]|nr:DUF4091 domain-containing protein [Kiritimatiellia bacterium]